MIPSQIAARGPATCRDCQREKRRVQQKLDYWRKRPWPQDHRPCRHCGEFKRVPDEIHKRGISCRTCQHERKLARQRAYNERAYHAMSDEERRAWNRAKLVRRNKAKHAASSRRWREQHPERARESERRWRQKVMADPARAAEWREYQRIYHRGWRQRKGMNVREIAPEVYANGNGKAPVRAGSIPATLLAPIIREWLGEFAGRQLSNVDYTRGRREEIRAATGAGQAELADLAGISDRTIRDIATGVRASIQYATADRLCAVMNVPLSSIYFDR